MLSAPPTAVFVDRDGVLIENVPSYVRSREDVKIFDQAVVAVRILFERRIPVIVVTNQAGVGRGIMEFDHVWALNGQILDAIGERAGGAFTGRYMCPHHPDDGCSCRKPKPGMLLQAASEHGIDLSTSLMIGDGVTDVEAGLAAGCASALVLTGRGREEEAKLRPVDVICPVFEDLLEAIRHYVPTDQGSPPGGRPLNE